MQIFSYFTFTVFPPDLEITCFAMILYRFEFFIWFRATKLLTNAVWKKKTNVVPLNTLKTIISRISMTLSCLWLLHQNKNPTMPKTKQKNSINEHLFVLILTVIALAPKIRLFQRFSLNKSGPRWWMIHNQCDIGFFFNLGKKNRAPHEELARFVRGQQKSL